MPAHAALTLPQPTRPVNDASVMIQAEPADVFGFLADVENLPKWAPDFCERIMIGRDGWRAFTELGELSVELTAAAGFVYLEMGFVGTTRGLFPLWITPRPDGGTRVTLACFQAEGLRDEAHERIYQALREALPGVKAAREARAFTSEPGALAV